MPFPFSDGKDLYVSAGDFVRKRPARAAVVFFRNLTAFGIRAAKDVALRILYDLLRRSIAAGSKQRGDAHLKKRLAEIAPDLSRQYTNFSVDTPYLVENVRSMHAFQIGLLQSAILLTQDPRVLVDIGDSAGTHAAYLKAMKPQLEVYSANLDPVAVAKIRAKGLKAELCRAEDLKMRADIFFSFEMLEHLTDPFSFLHRLSERGGCEHFVVTVPFVRRSRVGMHQLRHGRGAMNAENTHILELSPADWRLAFEFAGWRVVEEDIYLQYPTWHPLWLTKPLWRKVDFEGFYGAILAPAKSTYESWPASHFGRPS